MSNTAQFDDPGGVCDVTTISISRLSGVGSRLLPLS